MDLGQILASLRRCPLIDLSDWLPDRGQMREDRTTCKSSVVPTVLTPRTENVGVRHCITHGSMLVVFTVSCSAAGGRDVVGSGQVLPAESGPTRGGPSRVFLSSPPPDCNSTFSPTNATCKAVGDHATRHNRWLRQLRAAHAGSQRRPWHRLDANRSPLLWPGSRITRFSSGGTLRSCGEHGPETAPAARHRPAGGLRWRSEPSSASS